MATTAVQAVEKNITSVALADIQPSNYNPRKNFDETSLAELAESIRQQGVLQPIGVRPIADNRFEIVFGERRYRASLMAELAEIPAIVMEISDETAEEMAITENLQRKDVTPIEEANAYQKLIDSGRHDVQSLTVQFGKTEAYIRTRLKFVSLIPEIALLLEQDEITISVASEICRYEVARILNVAGNRVSPIADSGPINAVFTVLIVVSSNSGFFAFSSSIAVEIPRANPAIFGVILKYSIWRFLALIRSSLLSL